MPLVIHTHHKHLPRLFAQADQGVDVPKVRFVRRERVIVEPRSIPLEIDVRSGHGRVKASGVHAGEHDQDDVEPFLPPVPQDPHRPVGRKEPEQLPLGVPKPKDRIPTFVDETTAVWADPHWTDRPIC